MQIGFDKTHSQPIHKGRVAGKLAHRILQPFDPHYDLQPSMSVKTNVAVHGKRHDMSRSFRRSKDIIASSRGSTDGIGKASGQVRKVRMNRRTAKVDPALHDEGFKIGDVIHVSVKVPQDKDGTGGEVLELLPDSCEDAVGAQGLFARGMPVSEAIYVEEDNVFAFIDSYPVHANPTALSMRT